MTYVCYAGSRVQLGKVGGRSQWTLEGLFQAWDMKAPEGERAGLGSEPQSWVRLRASEEPQQELEGFRVSRDGISAAGTDAVGTPYFGKPRR